MEKEDNKEDLYKLLVAYTKENDKLFIENNMLKGKIKEAINYLNRHRFNKVSELKRILYFKD